MKAISYRIGSIDDICHAIGWPASFYVTNCNGFTSPNQLQRAMDESFDDGLISRHLELSLEAEHWPGSDRWDARILKLNCRTLDDCRAAFCQPLLGEYFFGFNGSHHELMRWEALAHSLVQKNDYAAFDLLFDAMKPDIPNIDAVQVWSANDCGLGERSANELVITGSQARLDAVHSLLSRSRESSFTTSFVSEISKVEWIEIV